MGKTEINNNTTIIEQRATKRQLVQIIAQRSAQMVCVLFVCLGNKMCFLLQERQKPQSRIYSARAYPIYLLLSATLRTFLNNKISRQTTKTPHFPQEVSQPIRRQLVIMRNLLRVIHIRRLVKVNSTTRQLDKYICFDQCFKQRKSDSKGNYLTRYPQFIQFYRILKAWQRWNINAMREVGKAHCAYRSSSSLVYWWDWSVCESDGQLCEDQ